jgi:hypothetical protein
MAHRCGAKKRDGGRCGKTVKEKGKKCKFHGGASTGPKTEEGKRKSAKNSLKHGIYSRYWTDEERVIAEGEIGRLQDLTQEILSAEIELSRIEALLEERRTDIRAGMELSNIDTAEGMEGGTTRQHFSMPNLRDLKNTYLGRVSNLKRMHQEMTTEDVHLEMSQRTEEYKDAVLGRIRSLTRRANEE